MSLLRLLSPSRLLSPIFRRRASDDRLIRDIFRRWQELAALNDEQLKAAAQQRRRPEDVIETFALAAAAAERVLNLRMFESQLRGALALSRGCIAEMQTGEGKTLAAVPAIAAYASHGRGVHVLTANDYLAARDAQWMRPVYKWLGLTVAHVSQAMLASERRAAYECDVTYATANEVGFDYLRDGLAREPGELVHRPFAFALFDEADSLLIDEARIPLVIAGGSAESGSLAYLADSVVEHLRAVIHYRIDEFARNVQLTDLGIEFVEGRLSCGSLFDERNSPVLAAVQDALHAHVLMRRDVDYVVRDGAIELVDEFKGRIAENRRWPAGLQAAIEAKEGLHLKAEGRVLGTITVQSLAHLYESICGMTGTAATDADEFWKAYKLPVTIIPPHRPVIREDLADVVFRTKEAREHAVVDEIRRVHATGRPILVGSASVESSEQLSLRLQQAGIPHAVLNARNDEAEAAVIAQAGGVGAVTVSTNMAGRGTDILLGGNPPVDRDRVVALGGLYVIGTTRHEARRIDNQLRGRAGRQGDPGTSRFFVSLEDDLLTRFGVASNPDIESVQRTAEGQNLEIRETLRKYDAILELHRREIYDLRSEILLGSDEHLLSIVPAEEYAALAETAGDHRSTPAVRQVVLAIMDDLWSDYLADIAELRGGIHWASWCGRNPLHQFLAAAKDIYADLHERLREEIAAALATAYVAGGSVQFPARPPLQRGATWTYLTTDQPFGTPTERLVRGLRRHFAQKRRPDTNGLGSE